MRPVVPGADYSVMRILYGAYPDEARELYELYRGAFVKNVALATGGVVMDASGSGPADASGSGAPQPPVPAPPDPVPTVPPSAR